MTVETLMPDQPQPIPVTVLTGFLGAGKTTLLNRILPGSHGLRIAAIVNDVGTVDVDAQMVQSVHGSVMSLWNGCICCDFEGDLRLSLLTLADMAGQIDYIVVEASGVADPVGIAATFRVPELRDRVRLDGIITLVDAEYARDPRLDVQLVRDQIAVADLVLLNKIDLVSDATRTTIHEWLASIAPQARIADTSHSGAPGPAPLHLVLGVGATRTDSPEDHAHVHAHRERFDTWTVDFDAPLDLHATLAALKSLPPGIFRAKGFLHLADAPRLKFVAQVVGARVSVDILGPWGDERPSTRLVFIGEKGTTTDRALEVQLLSLTSDTPAVS